MEVVLLYAVLGLALYLLMIRPQRNRARALAEVRAGLRVGSRVMTTAGIHATVLQVEPEGDTVLLEVAPDVPVRFATAAVVRILEPAPAEAADDAGTA